MPFLDWIGKDKVINHHNDVPFRVLERQYSYDESGQHTEDNGSKNMIIQGDNLEALKSLLPRYENKIKCIYIDPPYNTGNENWIYNDNVNDPKIQKWLGKVVGPESKDLTRHDKWLCMMYPRLKLLQKLLSDDGVIFISIDDNEQANLKLVCDEIFGSCNFICELIWKKKKGGSNDSKYVATEHEYIIMFSKNKENLEKIFIEYDTKYTSRYKEKDEKGYYFWDTFKRKSGKQYYPITCPDGTVLENDENGEPISWLRSKNRFLSDLNDGEVRLIKNNGKWTVHFKQRMPSGYKPRSIITEYGTTSSGTEELKCIFNKNVFNNPKPYELIEFLLKFRNDKNMVILDSFAGSGTTAHAVLNMNKADGGNRRFILIEMLDYADSITAERVKRVINGYGDGKKKVDGTGGDFSFYKLGEPIIQDDKINENLPVDIIRKYIWFTETRTDYNKLSDSDNGYFLGEFQGTDYYFYYEKDSLTTLNYDFCSKIDQVSSEYIIYADVCTLSEKELMKYNITFKKIPRDITRF